MLKNMHSTVGNNKKNLSVGTNYLKKVLGKKKFAKVTYTNATP